MFAQLGSIIFENLMGFTGLSSTEIANYGEHALLDGKPRLQFTGLALDELQINIRFHVSFCNPSVQLDALKTSKNSGEVLPLLWGNGKLEGSYVITEIDITTTDTDEQGNVFCYEITLSLKEYVAVDKLKQEQLTNKANAKAVGNKKPTAKKKSNVAVCSKQVSKIVTVIENHAALIESVFTTKAGPVTPTDKNNVKLHLAAANKQCTDLDARTKDTSSCAVKYPDIATANTNVKVEISKFSPQLDSFVSNSILSISNDSFQAAVIALKSASTTLINQAITRNP